MEAKPFTSSKNEVNCAQKRDRTFSFFLLPSSFRVNARRAFTLIEMLVVVGLIAILMGAGMAAYSSATRKAQQARARHVVSNVATAIESVYQREGSFPRRIMAQGSSDGEMTPEVAYELARRNAMSLRYSGTRTIGADRCGVLTPWGQDVVKRSSSTGSMDGQKVPSGGTIKDHRVHFAVDTEGHGIVNASVGGESVKIRASAVAWCCGRDGKMYPYSEGLRHGCSYSWSAQQVVR